MKLLETTSNLFVHNPIKKYFGVITFLDILGWKGIYNRKKDPLTDLSNLIELIDAKTRGEGNTYLKSISDTIVLFTDVPVDENRNEVFELHGRICSEAIIESINLGIPVRGATSYGEFEVSENMYVGKAVDEAASWYETGDWIGVHMTPSAEFIYEQIQASGESVWISYRPKLKWNNGWETHCVNWIDDCKTKGQSLNELKQFFHSMSPIVPEISTKFTNTIAFYEQVDSEK